MTENRRQTRRHFSAGWRTTALTMVLLPLMTGLGFWQLDRAQEKRLIQKEAEEQQSMPPLGVDALNGAEFSGLRYRSVLFSCQWLPQYFLLDNQVQNGKVGYQVIGLAKLGNGAHVLVNRGWLAMDPDRSRLPDVPPVVAGEEIGEIYFSEELIKDEPVYAEMAWPRRVQRLHVPALSRESGVELLPFIVRLHEGSPSALAVNWPVINMLPEKHEAYAIQWFAMAAALIIFYTVLAFRQDDTTREYLKNTESDK